jgi:phosphoribosylaminoimidazolecarboxamide formyltransferase/IMP cyclohydrolase
MNQYDWTASSNDYISIHGGFLSQTIDYAEENFNLISGESLDSNQLKDLKIAWKVAKHIKSNAITIVKNGILIGMGAGQPNRVESTKLAIYHAKDNVQNSVLASDAFFPFPDSVELAGIAGIQAVAQPGGSIRDEETIQAVKKYNMSLYHTGIRHFRH